ncbi:hypothetical protein CIG2463D_1373 [Campylobacter iguaniorum]|nr:hypothetical protein CIG2463D_1373 [Campylobacter iguaniorum]
MKKVFLAFLVAVCGLSVANAEYVQGHYRSNGTYVDGYHRSDRDSSKLNNYSTKGNTNPYTGERGSHNPW